VTKWVQSENQAAPPSFSATPELELNGTLAAGEFGWGLTRAGDLNGDGLDDIAIGAYAADLSTGAFHVYYGAAGGPSTSPDLTVDGSARSSSFGEVLSGGGDVNGDGYDDLIVGAPDTGGSTGAVYVYLGSSGGLDGTAALSLTGPGASSKFGSTAVIAGDINGDGYDDVAVGAPWYDSFKGEFQVYYGSAVGLDVDSPTTVTPTSTILLGGLVVGPGDVNGDGYADLLVLTSGLGLRLYLGSASGLVTSTYGSVVYTGGGSTFGSAMAPAGDVNGDGLADVVIGSYNYDTYRGACIVALGSASGLAEADMTVMDGPNTADMLGYSVAGAGDFDGDGYADVVGGEPNWEAPGQEGRMDLYLGGPSMDITSDGTAYGDTKDAGFGYTLSGAGDVNGDGYDDVMAGQYAYSSYSGAVWIYYGGPPASGGDTGSGDDSGGAETGGGDDSAAIETGGESGGPETGGGDDSASPESGGPGDSDAEATRTPASWWTRAAAAAPAAGRAPRARWPWCWWASG
jgi:hypothetical protein